MLNTTFTFGESDNLMNASLAILNDFLSEKRKCFNISIKSINTYYGNASPGQGALTLIIGEAIKLTVYDNDCEFGSYVVSEKKDYHTQVIY